MSIAVTCGGCGKTYKVDDAFAGKKAKCKSCGGVMVVPSAKPVAAAPARPTASARVKPAPKKPDPEPGEFDFSAIDDVENSGQIEQDTPETAQRFARSSEPEKPQRTGYTAAPAHLRGGAGAGTTKAKGPKFSPSVKIYWGGGGGVLVALISIGIRYMLYSATHPSDSSSSTTNSTPSSGGGGISIAGVGNASLDDDDKGPLTAAKLAARAAKRKQAELDAIAPGEVPKLPYPILKEFPELPEKSDGDVVTYTVHLEGGEFLGVPMAMVLMLPKTDNEPAPHSLPCVLVPAEATPLDGRTLEEPDLQTANMLCKTGVAVMVFDISRFSSNARPQDYSSLIQEFIQSETGMHFARNALNFIEARAPMIDMKRIYGFGMGGSARVMLNYATMEPRIRGVATVDPWCDALQHLTEPVAEAEKQFRTGGLEKYLKSTSPVNQVKEIKCPVLVLVRDEASGQDLIGEAGGTPSPSDGADTAAKKPVDEVTAFIKAMEGAGGKVTREPVKKIPDVDAREALMGQVSRWIKKLDGKPVFSE